MNANGDGDENVKYKLRSFDKLLAQVESVAVRGELRGKITTLLEDLGDEKEKSNKLMERANKSEEKLTHIQGVVGAIAARSGVDEIFIKKVKKFLPIKEPGTSYTGSQIEKAYRKFFASNDNYALELKRKFPNKSNKALAKEIRKIYGILCDLDRTLLRVLLNVYTLEKLMDFVRAIPAVLSKNQLHLLEQMIKAYLETSDDSESDDDSGSEDDLGTEVNKN